MLHNILFYVNVVWIIHHIPNVQVDHQEFYQQQVLNVYILHQYGIHFLNLPILQLL